MQVPGTPGQALMGTPRPAPPPLPPDLSTALPASCPVPWPGSRGSSSFLALSPESARSFLETTSVPGPVAFASVSGVSSYFSKSANSSAPLPWQPGPPGLPLHPSTPCSFDNSLTHPLLFQMEKKTEAWQGLLPPAPQWTGRSPPRALSSPGRPRSPDNRGCVLPGSVNLAAPSTRSTGLLLGPSP